MNKHVNFPNFDWLPVSQEMRAAQPSTTPHPNHNQRQTATMSRRGSRVKTMVVPTAVGGEDEGANSSDEEAEYTADLVAAGKLKPATHDQSATYNKVS